VEIDKRRYQDELHVYLTYFSGRKNHVLLCRLSQPAKNMKLKTTGFRLALLMHIMQEQE
jgi:hypothetical protein